MQRERARASATFVLGLAVVVIGALPRPAMAQHRGQVTAQVYMSYNEPQQLIYVDRLAASQREVVEECAADLSSGELREYFNQWIDETPGYLSRDVMLAFTAAILDRCREGRLTQPETRLQKIEQGAWTLVPYLPGYFHIDVFDDFTFQADDPDQEINDLFTEARLNMFAMFARQLYVESGFLFAPVGEPPPGNNTFENHGLRVATLGLTWDREWFWVGGGKGLPNSGIAADLAPGIWGGDVVYDFFKVKGRLGFAGNVNLGSEQTGHHALYASAFTADNSFLSRPYLSDGEPSSRADGGPSNTGRLNSFVFTVDGTGIPVIGGLRYHVSGMKQAVDRVNGSDGEPLPEDQIDDEYRLAVGLEWSAIEVGDEGAITPLAEYGQLWNARGLKDRTERFITGSILLTTGVWNAAVAGTSWTIDSPEDDELVNYLFQVSGGYSFASGISLDVGYRLLDEFGIVSHTLGIVFSYGLPFAG